MSSFNNFNDIVNGTDNLVAYLRNLPNDTFEFTGVPGEFTNWIEEQIAGHQTAVLLHQGHMRSPVSEFYVKGPDAFKLLNYVGANSFLNFKPDVAKQYIVCNHEGYLIGDCILLYLEENSFCLVGAMVLIEWIKYQARINGFDVTCSSNDTVQRDGKELVQKYYQFQIQGPKAEALFTKLNGSFPNLRFFHMGEITIAGHKVRCLRHSMLGEPGLECWFPLELRGEVIGAIVEAGAEFGLKQVGTRAYPSQTLESGWMGMPLPAIYSGEEMDEYRKCLSLDSFEAQFSIAGSYIGDNIREYYYTPYEMNYGNFVKFDHDFIGRAALEKMQAQPHGRKVTLEWRSEDVAKIHGSFAGTEELPYKWMELPYATYGMVQCDRVSKDGKTIGRSADAGYSHYARATLSLAVVDPDIEIGDEVIVTWGEEGGGTRKNSVERHRQIEVRAVVRPAPYTKVARETYYNAGWRAKQNGGKTRMAGAMR